jgi:hypothetical protein
VGFKLSLLEDAGVGGGCFDRMFFLCWLRCSLTMGMDLGRCCQTSWVVRSGQVAKWPLFMAFNQVDGIGLPQDACRNWHNSSSMEAW